MRRLVVLAGLILAGCPEDMGDGVPDLSAQHDLAMPQGTPIGGQCLLSTDCKHGVNAICRKNRGTRTGVCSADCTTDADCGTGNVCLFQPPPGSNRVGACAKPCVLASDCTEGIGCWVTLDKQACWPLNQVQDVTGAVVLNCNPTVAGCTFTGNPPSTLPGGCRREVLGAGLAGSCRRGCDIGVGTCPPGGGFQQNCYFIDETIDTSGNSTGDALKQPICVVAAPVGSPPAYIADGMECIDPADGKPYFDICDLGSQCEVYTTLAGQTADNKCHKLCYLNNFTPPEMGMLFLDGGAVDGTCPAGQTCSDVFGASSATPPSMPVGLCKP